MIRTGTIVGSSRPVAWSGVLGAVVEGRQQQREGSDRRCQ